MIDVNAAYGPWPFQEHGILTGRRLARHLGDVGVTQALVTHLGAVFAPDPHAHNLKLCRELAGIPSLHPVPTLNPALRGWRRDLDELPLRPIAVRLLPTYHNYRLNNPRLREFASYCADEGLPTLLQLRMDDERTRYFGLRIPLLKTGDVAEFVGRHPALRLAVLNAYLPEIREIAPAAPSVLFDTSFAEWLFTVEELLESVDAGRILFGSHTPLLETSASSMKVFEAVYDRSVKRRIALSNAARFFQNP